MPTSGSGNRPFIGITMGDPSGIGPEVVLKALTCEQIRKRTAFLIIGDLAHLKRIKRSLKLGLKIEGFNPAIFAVRKPGTVVCLDLKNVSLSKCRPGIPNRFSGRASFEYIREAVGLALSGQIDALVTAPISKEALNKAGVNYPGHTELLAHLTATRDYCMMLMGGGLKVILVTTHIPLAKVSRAITEEKVFRIIRLADRSFKRHFKLKKPRIGVAGLNPHASDGGLFGGEEEKKLAPAVRRARKEGIDATGPVPGDVLFYETRKKRYDVAVAMYHDQGLAPLKLLAFERGVNVTLGLPFIRTSPDHGTAFDIASQFKANPESMKEAIKAAIRFSFSKE